MMPAKWGGDETNSANLILLTLSALRQMRAFQEEVERRWRAGEVIDFSAKPMYGDATRAPEQLLLQVTGSRGEPLALVIHNKQRAKN